MFPSLLAIASLLATLTSPARDAFDARFTGRALRFDYHHSGTTTEEHVALDELRLEGEWPGSRVHLVDDTGYGKYLFVLLDADTLETLYSRGFASIYGEWETTGEAKTLSRSFHESQRFPEPRAPAWLVLKKRVAADGSWDEIYRAHFDPASHYVNRAPVTPRGEVHTLFENGPARDHVDLLVLGDGYTAAESAKFRSDVERLTGALFSTEPFASRRSDFNLRAIHVPAAESGISNPRKGVWRDAPLGSSFNAFDSDRYVLTYANEILREVAAQVPYDALVIVFNDEKYGGGGIFNLWATCAADTSVADYVFVHELGHSFAGLADEYYSSQVAYEEFNPPGTEPWEPNVTALLDPARLKWKDLVLPDTPLPTPWDQDAYDAIDREYQEKRAALIAAKAPEEAAEALFREVKAATAPLLQAEPYFDRTGAFEGASYEPKGLYRPAADCIMFTRNPTTFCAVCARALDRTIDLYVE